MWLAWPMCAKEEVTQRKRLIRLLLQQYRDAGNRGLKLPADVEKLLRDATGAAAKNPPGFDAMLKALDANERATEGAKAFWETHAAGYAWGNLHVHPSLYGPLGPGAVPASNEWFRRNALVHGHQYLALTGATCALIADLTKLRERIVARCTEWVFRDEARDAARIRPAGRNAARTR